MFLLISGIFILIYAAIGFYRGMTASVLHLMSTVFALWVGLQFYKPLNDYLRLFIPFPKTDAFDTTYAIQFDQPESRFNALVSLLLIVFIVKVIAHVVLDTFATLIYRHRNFLVLRVMGVSVSMISAGIVLHFIFILMALYPDANIQLALQHTPFAQWLITKLPILSQYTMNLI